MKIDLSIYQSILFHDLRPWLDANKSDDKFRTKITPNFKKPTENSIDFDNAINKALIDFKSTLNEDEYLFELDADQVQFNGVVAEILYPLIEIKADEPLNNKTTFYYFLIKNEATRLINNLYKFSFLKITENEKKATIILTIRAVNSLLAKVEQQKKIVSKDGNHSNDPNNAFILHFLGLTLIRLHLEIKELFEIYVTGNGYDEAGIYANILKQNIPQESHIKDTVGLNHFKVLKYINQPKHKKETTLELILHTLETFTKYYSKDTTNKEEIKRRKVLLEDIQALENLYFLQHYKLNIENINYTSLIVNDALDTIFNDTFQAITEAIEEQYLPNKKQTIINKEIQKLEFLKCDIEIDNSLYLKSVPRQLQDALNATKLFINSNLSIDFSKITEPKTNPLKTNLSVPQIAFLFKLLNEVKPDIFQVPTNAELFRFISQNFATKKSTAEGISTKKLADLFREPDTNAQQFWYDIIANWYTDKKKFK